MSGQEVLSVRPKSAEDEQPVERQLMMDSIKQAGQSVRRLLEAQNAPPEHILHRAYLWLKERLGEIIINDTVELAAIVAHDASSTTLSCAIDSMDAGVLLKLVQKINKSGDRRVTANFESSGPFYLIELRLALPETAARIPDPLPVVRGIATAQEADPVQLFDSAVRDEVNARIAAAQAQDNQS